MNKPSIVVFDDDSLYVLMLKNYLKDCHIVHFEQYHELHNPQKFTLALIDLNFHGEFKGIEILQAISNKLPCYILSSEQSDELTQKVYELGAKAFFQKGHEKEFINQLISKITHQSKDSIESIIAGALNTSSKELLESSYLAVEKFISGVPLHLNGPTGTGKGHFAKILSQNLFPDRKFYSISLAGMNANIIESELFGHVKGAFTGADSDKVGLLESVGEGILFIDELCSTSINIQTKLLKVLEEKEFYSVGSNKIKKYKGLTISASQPRIYHLISQNQFREDLFFRLCSNTIHLPELQKRSFDIPDLIKLYATQGVRVVFKDCAVKLMQDYHWPGNIRELRNFIYGLKAESKGVFKAQDIKLRNTSTSNSSIKIAELGLRNYIKGLEKDIVSKQLSQNNNNIRQTVRDLKISFSTFYNIMKR